MVSKTLETRIKQAALETGAAVVGIGARERLNDAPPSGDPSYLLASTRSIIAFAIPYDRTVLRNYFAKADWRSQGDDKKRVQQTLYRINDRLVDLLKAEGFEALGVDGNCVYRPEDGAEDVTDMTDFYPDFSHRYGAIAAGLGRLGWSGNLITPDYGSAVALGTVLTSAVLPSDPLCETHPCDGCKLCATVCPVEMMDRKKSVTVRVAGMTDEIAAKRPNTCCFIGCSDYHGASVNGKWSNWTPYRVAGPLPADKAELDALCMSTQKADPMMHLETNMYTDYRASIFDPETHEYAACGHCANICWKDRAERVENRRVIVNAGVVALRMDGSRTTVAEDDALELDTPFAVSVIVVKSEYAALKEGRITVDEGSGLFPKDREVIAHIVKTAREEAC